jgi:plasmid stabilization system protein ParE
MNDSMDYRVTVSDAALAMLDSHIEFLARVNAQAAENLMNEILDDIESLVLFPERFPIFDSEFIPDGRYRKMLSARRYLILYEIDKNDVCVDYIVDCRRDYEWLLL